MIYLMNPSAGGPFKIGHSIKPLSRLSAVASHFPYDVNIVATFEGGRAEEQFLHECFRPITVKSTASKEWFYNCPSMWRFALNLMDSGRPSFIPDFSTKACTQVASSLAREIFGSERAAMDHFGYSLTSTVRDTFALSSSISAGVWPRLVFVREMKRGNIPDYIASLHQQAVSEASR